AAQLAHFDHSTKATTQHLSAIIPFYWNFTRNVNKLDGIYLHDPTTLAYLVAPDAFQTHKWPLRVETENFSRGKTWVTGHINRWSLAWENRPLVNVCVDVDGSRISNLILERLL
ncbi:MAG: nucleoside hydrolase, partial [Anaerolineae bacterium]|nr:nucleoside hydrolase [Anaerolineae bacterium]